VHSQPSFLLRDHRSWPTTYLRQKNEPAINRAPRGLAALRSGRHSSASAPYWEHGHGSTPSSMIATLPHHANNCDTPQATCSGTCVSHGVPQVPVPSWPREPPTRNHPSIHPAAKQALDDLVMLANSQLTQL
jgi:hypothetical protein